MLSCKQITDLVTDYAEGAMGLWDRMQFQLHIGMCGKCRAYVAQVKHTVASLGRLPDEPIPDEVCDELMQRFRNWKAADPAD